MPFNATQLHFTKHIALTKEKKKQELKGNLLCIFFVLLFYL